LATEFVDHDTKSKWRSSLSRLLRNCIAQQVRWSVAFDGWLPPEYRLDGNGFFTDSFHGKFLRHGDLVYDVGGGKTPIISADRKRELGLRVVGLDISAAELARAPAGCYDNVVCADITTYRGDESADVVICQALLEHVPSTEDALRAIASILKPSGVAVVFVPSRNAVFARLNLVLPERVKKALLFTIFPAARDVQGFRSYYNRCTPRDFEDMARACGLEVEERHLFYTSMYFSFFLPLHLLWRSWVLLFRMFAKEQAAETFIYAFRKPLRGV